MSIRGKMLRVLKMCVEAMASARETRKKEDCWSSEMKKQSLANTLFRKEE